jgi:putative glutamine amidotransferase
MATTKPSPRILVPIPVQDAERRRFTLGKNYVRSLIACGAVPVLLPTALDHAAWRDMYAQADGVLLSGGGDVEPGVFGEDRHPATDDINPERDDIEIALARWALEDDKPVFAICRGIQVVNVALGGSLIQDIPSQRGQSIEHRGSAIGAARDQVLHEVCIDPGTRIAGVFGQGNVGVNSFHHQAIKVLGDGLIITSRAPDGIIESVEAPGKRYYLGVQWHPEEMTEGRDDMLSLFQSFVDASSERKD